jgi:hypothetical protein
MNRLYFGDNLKWLSDRKGAFHRCDLWIAEALETLAAGDDDVALV